MTGTDRGLRRLRYVLWALVALALVGLALYQFAPQGGRGSVAATGTGTLGRGDYRLVSTDGGSFTQETLAGGPSAVFFGFTHCPDVCPTTLGDIATWREELGPEGEALRVFFVTVDPERDPVEVLRDYVSWVPGVIGVTGSPEEMAKATKAFRIYARKVPQDGGGYSMDHSSTMLLFDRDGEYAGLIGYQQEHERTMASLRALLKG